MLKQSRKNFLLTMIPVLSISLAPLLLATEETIKKPDDFCHPTKEDGLL